MVDCCGFQASLTLSGWGGRGREKREKKRKLHQTTARQTEDEQRERDSLFKRASAVTVCSRITWFGGRPCHSLSSSHKKF